VSPPLLDCPLESDIVCPALCSLQVAIGSHLFLILYQLLGRYEHLHVIDMEIKTQEVREAIYSMLHANKGRVGGLNPKPPFCILV
jgi:hypothetical protein